MLNRDIILTLCRAAESVYDHQEARAIAELAALELWGISREKLAFEPEGESNPKGLPQVVERIVRGEPIQYIIGYTEWYDMQLKVGDGVLIPRPETEELTRRIIADHRGVEGLRVVDLGTGSGAIAIALSKHLVNSHVVAFDISEKALAIARHNAENNNAEVDFRQGDMLAMEPVEGLDIVVSNPPYVPQSDLPTMNINVRDWEPHTALFVPDDNPLIFYKAIVEFAVGSLRTGGSLYCEIYEHYAEQMLDMAAKRGLPDGEVFCDMMDKPRMIRWIKR